MSGTASQTFQKDGYGVTLPFPVLPAEVLLQQCSKLNHKIAVN